MRAALVLPLLLFATPARAAQQDAQFWFQTNVHVPLGERWRVTLEGIARTSDRLGGIYQTEVGALLTRKLAPNVELGVGYRRVGFHSRSTAADEDRWRQQIAATFGPVSTRLRVDERFHPDGDEIGFRIRPLIRYNLKLGTKGYGLFASHESFFLPNSTAWGQRAGYERMRNSIGVVVPLATRFSADIGYLNQYRLARGGSRAQKDHALSVQLTFALAAHHPPPPAGDD